VVGQDESAIDRSVRVIFPGPAALLAPVLVVVLPDPGEVFLGVVGPEAAVDEPPVAVVLVTMLSADSGGVEGLEDIA
jgi:hypothetical protein